MKKLMSFWVDDDDYFLGFTGAVFFGTKEKHTAQCMNWGEVDLKNKDIYLPKNGKAMTFDEYFDMKKSEGKDD